MCSPHHFSYPAAGADIFAKLSKGSVVVLYQGAGDPAVTEVSTSEVVLAVGGFSALTNTGRRLCCTDSSLMKVPGDRLTEAEYEVGDLAWAILRDTGNLDTLKNLIPKQVVYIPHGYGIPAVEDPDGTDAIIAYASGTFAITTCGRLITVADAPHLVGTDLVTAMVGRIHISATAKQIFSALTRGIEPPHPSDIFKEEK